MYKEREIIIVDGDEVTIKVDALSGPNEPKRNEKCTQIEHSKSDMVVYFTEMPLEVFTSESSIVLCLLPIRLLHFSHPWEILFSSF